MIGLVDMSNLKQINDFHEKQMEAMLGFLEPTPQQENEYDALKETRDFCVIEDCTEPATIEIKDLDFKGNRFCALIWLWALNILTVSKFVCYILQKSSFSAG